MRAPDAFITTGYPTSPAARTAAAALVTSCSRGTRIPYARSSCFAACSLSLLPGRISACALRKEGDGVRGASSKGERYAAANRAWSRWARTAVMQFATVRKVATRDEPSRVSRYADSVPTGEPHTTETML